MRIMAARGPSERQIQETCAQLLSLDGWRRVRTDMAHLRGLSVQEPGMADDLFIRYGLSYMGAPGSAPELRRADEVLWIEWKRERGSTSLNPKKALFTRAEKASIRQKAWHATERARGALTLIAGEDFPATIEGFCMWYRKSGLMRRNLSTAALQNREVNANCAG